MLNVNIQCFVVYALGWCWWTGGVSWRDAVRVKFCLFYSLSISAFFYYSFSPPSAFRICAEYIIVSSGQKCVSSVLANCRFNWRLWANYKSNLSTFCAACGLRAYTCECLIWVCLWQHPHLLYVKQSGCRRSCQSDKSTMRSEGECARREQDGVNRVCVCVLHGHGIN